MLAIYARFRFLLYSILISCVAFAQFEPLTLSKYFSLTDAQVAQWDQLKAANRQENAERNAKRGTLRVEFAQLLAAEPLDESRLGANQVAQVQLDREEASAKTRLSERIVALLDANQRAKLDALAEAQKLAGVVRDAECQSFLPNRQPVVVLNGTIFNACPDDGFFGGANPLAKDVPAAEDVVGFPSVVIRYLELSPSQEESLSAIRDAYLRAQAPKQVDRAAMVQKLYGSELTRSVLDPAAIGKLIADITRLDRSFRISDQELVRQLRAGLTEAQIAKLDGGCRE
jgi:Spy/CpxP family protein refolding chaperone